MAMRTASGKVAGASARKLRMMEIEPADNGGHAITHHFVPTGASVDSFSPPEVHSFGPEEGHEVVEHIKKHLGIKVGDKEEHEESPHDEAAENEEEPEDKGNREAA
jgi:hypothetical protein